MTQIELGKVIGLSVSFVGHIERGTRVLSVDTLLRIANALEVSTDALLTGRVGLADEAGRQVFGMRMMQDMMHVLRDHMDEWLYLEEP